MIQSSGLVKLEETKKKVEELSITLAESQKEVARLQKECDDYLMVIVGQRQEANEQAKEVQARSDKIQQEEAQVKAEAELAQKDLDDALPALDAAKKALQALNKKDLSEIKTYPTPPLPVEKVMEAVMILMRSEPTWAEAKRQLNDANFITYLVHYDIKLMSDSVLKKIERICADPDFKPEKMAQVSGAATSLCMWVRAMERYGHVHREVAPKKAVLKEALEKLEVKQQLLQDAKEKLKAANDKVAELKAKYKELVSKKDKFRNEMLENELKLSRAEKMVTGLASERERYIGIIHDHHPTCSHSAQMGEDHQERPRNHGAGGGRQLGRRRIFGLLWTIPLQLQRAGVGGRVVGSDPQSGYPHQP